MRIYGALGTILGGVLFGAFLLLGNGGLIYKTTCPLPGGSTQTQWTYAINDIIPYIRSTSPPCHSHTATRLLLSVTHIAPLHDQKSAASAADVPASRPLQAATSAIVAEYTREQRVMAPVQPRIKNDTLTDADRSMFASQVSLGINRFTAAKRALDKPAASTDARLAEARRLLSRWLGLQIAIGRLYFTATSQQSYMSEQTKLLEGVRPITLRLRELAPDIQARHPNVSDWDFLYGSGGRL